MNKIFLQGGTLLLSLFFLFSSCADDKLDAGIELLPDSDRFSAGADTIAVSCFTDKGTEGFVYTSQSEADRIPFGQVNDSLFGKSSVDVAMELTWNTTNYYGRDTIQDSDKPKSLKLYLYTSEIQPYGVESGFNAEVYLLNARYGYTGSINQNIVSDLHDFKNDREINTTHRVYKGFNPNIELDTNYYLVVELDTSLARDLMDSIYSIDEFYNVLPGLVLKANARVNSTDSTGSLQSFLPNKSGMVLEFERPGGSSTGGDTTLFTNFTINKYQCAYRHVQTGSGLKTTFRDTTNQYDNFYIQGLGGTQGIVKLDSLIRFKEKWTNKVGVNLAELVLPINQESLIDSSSFHLPNRVRARGLTQNGFYIIPDDIISPFYFNGFLDRDAAEYRINISEYVNRFMQGDLEEDELLLSINTALTTSNSDNNSVSDYRTPARVVLTSGLPGNTNKAFIRIIYTRIDQ